MIKSLHVVPTYRPAWRYGGPIHSVHGLCKALTKQGSPVSVYTTNVDGDTDMDLPLATPNSVDGVTVWYFPVGWPRRLYRSPQMKNALKESIKSHDIVHLHSVFLWPTWVAAMLARAENIPYIVSPRGMLVPELIRAKSRLKKSLSIYLFDRRVLEAADAVHFTSALEKRECEAVNIKVENAIVLPNGIDQNDVVIGPGVDGATRRYVLYFGRISWKKGIDRLMEAVCQLPHVSLVIAGNDDENYKPKLEFLAKRLGIDDRTEFRGEVGVNEKWELLSGAIVLVLPSLSENFGNVVLEAMLVKTPVVVTEGVGLADLVSSSGAGLVTGPLPSQIAAGIKRFIKSPEYVEKCGQAGHDAVVRDYSWSNIAKAMKSAYEDILRKRSRTVIS